MTAAEHDIPVQRRAPQGLNQSFDRRAMFVGYFSAALISAALVAVLGRVVQIQYQPSPGIRSLVDSQNSNRNLPGRRGNITDRHGRVLATSQLVPRLFVDSLLIDDHNTFSERVGYGLAYDPAWVERQLASQPGGRYIVLDDRLSDTRLASAQRTGLPGLAIEYHPVRDYPLKTIAGNLMGFVGTDHVGLEGVELAFDQPLRARSGQMQYWRDARREPLWIEQNAYQPPVDGQSVRLSLDVVIQTIAEDAVAATCRQYSSPHGQAVVIQPHTGEILAMANYPTTDPASFARVKPEERRNRCITDAFEPGSTFKPFIWAAATEAGVARPEESIDCTTSGVYVAPFGRRLRDAHPNGLQTWDGVLVKSSNIGMAIVGQRLGTARMYEAVRAFGFGQPTGVQLPGESPGLVTPRKQWTLYTATSVPMGHEVAVTPLQIARGFCIFANGGLLVQPTILARDPADQRDRLAIRERVLSPAVASHTRDVLRRVITEGTGRKADIGAYPIFGKTGTAQVPDRERGGYRPGYYTAAFICGAPYNDPQIVVCVFIHITDASKEYYGGVVAAPTAARIVERSLAYLGVQPAPVSRHTVARAAVTDDRLAIHD